MTQLTTTAMLARLDRLAELAKGLSSEVVLWRPRDGPLLQAERRVYLGALQDAIQSTFFGFIGERSRTLPDESAMAALALT
jgi:hypothetical protein